LYWRQRKPKRVRSDITCAWVSLRFTQSVRVGFAP
jgi:hypothetical protein